MIYTRNGKYYIKRPEKMVEIIAINRGDNVDFIPTEISVPINGELMTYTPVSVNDIKANFVKKPEKVEKVEKIEEPEVENKFAGLFSDKTTKNKKNL